MDKMQIRGGNRLKGHIRIGGAKNAALTLMPAALLTAETLTLSNVPHLADIATMGNLLGQHGVKIALNGATDSDGHIGRVMEFTTKEITNTTAPYDIVRKMRASILVLGPILARCGEAKVSLPGGCAIGTRPVDLHLKGMEALGAEIELLDGYVQARAPRGLRGAEIVFPTVSVGATENVLMAATLAQGDSTLINVAREPEITDLAHCLVAMGAKIEGIGTDTLHVTGQIALRGARHEVIPDRIEAGTFLMAALMTDGDLVLDGARLDHLQSVVRVLEQTGAEIKAVEGGVRVRRKTGTLHGVDVTTEPFPGFPTDLQAQFMALMCVAEGAARIDETIFENRFMHVPELLRMGADITVHGGAAMVRGVTELHGAAVMATDLRASVSLVLAGLAATGETLLQRIYHLDRGYERLEDKLSACGAAIVRLRAEAA
ncbi:MAG: UDP-N-acetylglucosamine 1-carboxyvinyltransferase [Alphaproteobacteria bacterium]|nr:UDP-N-acetylglucosamine 1-carboxyvinyltransferase [Alphaproteobacteria bacterium]